MVITIVVKDNPTFKYVDLAFSDKLIQGIMLEKSDKEKFINLFLKQKQKEVVFSLKNENIKPEVIVAKSGIDLNNNETGERTLAFYELTKITINQLQLLFENLDLSKKVKQMTNLEKAYLRIMIAAKQNRFCIIDCLFEKLTLLEQRQVCHAILQIQQALGSIIMLVIENDEITDMFDKLYAYNQTKQTILLIKI